MYTVPNSGHFPLVFNSGHGKLEKNEVVCRYILGIEVNSFVGIGILFPILVSL